MHTPATRIRLSFFMWGLAAAMLASTSARAGGGPENVLLIVNANSESSKTIANHYIALRKIPPENVLYLDWKGNLESGSAENLREKILRPAHTALDERKLRAQIDYMVYSSDFPWQFDLKPAFPDAKFPPPFDASASITGATYLQSFLFAKNPAIVNPDTNWYVPGPRGVNEGRCTQLVNVPTGGFRSHYQWNDQGNRVIGSGEGQNYFLSTMLGVTQGRGNTVEEVIAYLRRAAASDGTRPQGTIYFMWNKDVRSTTRDKCFEAVAAQINAIPGGARAKVAQGVLPDGAKDVTGLMVGASDFDLKKSGVVIRPGSICEHLTSTGGYLFNVKAQTPLSEFLRHGAAGASGTVAEPHAIQAKFPLASLQLHYARGCSLAESFYQSISGPYQILIVGDPLCQPWATPPKITIQGLKPNEVVKGTITITPAGVATRPLSSIEIFMDGKRIAAQAPGKSLEIDTNSLRDGYHEIRLIGIDSSPIETQGRLVVPFSVANHDADLQFSASSNQVKFLEKIRLTVRQPGATSITIRQNSRDLASVQGEAGDVEVPAAKMGRGPTTLQALSEGSVKAISAPLRLVVE